jgi:TPP-dependent pyruvate/acetoin dehydrogenase alpha subunit
MADQKPTIGRIVHYRLAEHDGVRADSVGKYRPAIIVETWGENSPHVNLRVFLDGSNDCKHDEKGNVIPASEWSTSRMEGTEPGTWRWPPR